MRLFLYVAALAAISLPLAAQDAPIRQTIQSQLDAMLADDFPKAYTFASPTIKRIFGPVENFEAMVKKGYPMVWQHQAVQMLELRSIAGNLWQRVMVTDATGGRSCWITRWSRRPRAGRSTRCNCCRKRVSALELSRA